MSYSTTVKSRKIHTEYRKIPGYGLARAVLRFDDQCGNGQNSFSITMESKAQKRNSFGGCMHEQIAAVFPHLAPLIKWHLTDTKQPLHYIANTVYWAENEKLDYARRSAIAPLASLEQLLDKKWLADRLPGLMIDFKADMVRTFNL